MAGLVPVTHELRRPRVRSGIAVKSVETPVIMGGRHKAGHDDLRGRGTEDAQAGRYPAAIRASRSAVRRTLPASSRTGSSTNS